MLIGALEKYSIRLSCRGESNDEWRRESVKISPLFGPSTTLRDEGFLQVKAGPDNGQGVMMQILQGETTQLKDS